MKKIYFILSIAILTVFFSCSKDKRITRRLSGQSYKTLKVTITSYFPGTPATATVNTTDNTIINFEKKGVCTVGAETGTYEVTGPVGKEEGYLNISTDTNYEHYKITEFSRNKMILYDDSEYYSAYGEGYIVEIELEKL